MPWNAVLLDLYDTLVWTEWSAFRELLSARLGVDAETLLRAFDVTRPARSIGAYPDAASDIAAILAALDIQDDETVADIVRLQRDFWGSAERVHLHDDSIPTVRALRRHGFKTAIVSNCSHQTRTELQDLGIEPEFDAIVLSFEVKVKKPQPEIYRAALDALDVPPSAALFVDDQAHYCDGARDLGMDTRLIVRPGAEPPEGLSPETNGHQIIGSLAALVSG
jgi:putative hydrolase of the HAD superfamily